jgi:hypothetical protein
MRASGRQRPLFCWAAEAWFPASTGHIDRKAAGAPDSQPTTSARPNKTQRKTLLGQEILGSNFAGTSCKTGLVLAAVWVAV